MAGPDSLHPYEDGPQGPPPWLGPAIVISFIALLAGGYFGIKYFGEMLLVQEHPK